MSKINPVESAITKGLAQLQETELPEVVFVERYVGGDRQRFAVTPAAKQLLDCTRREILDPKQCKMVLDQIFWRSSVLGYALSYSRWANEEFLEGFSTIKADTRMVSLRRPECKMGLVYGEYGM